MMKTRFFITLSLIGGLIAACAPAATPTEAEATQVGLNPSMEPTTVPTLDSAIQPTAVLTQEPVAVATSRGPELHATDPSTVSLASGQIQFVEFFRFT